MFNFTSITYQMKREILNFSNKISAKLSKPERKFYADMTYGMLAAKSCLLTDISDQLHEPSKKVNIVDRLRKHLEKGISKKAWISYLQLVRKMVDDNPVIYIDVSDVINPKVLNLNLSVLSGIVLKVLLIKPFTKKVITLQKHAFVLKMDSLSVSFRKFIHRQKRTFHLLTRLPATPSGKVLPYFKKQLLLWIAVMMIIKSFSCLMNYSRIMSFV